MSVVIKEGVCQTCGRPIIYILPDVGPHRWAHKEGTVVPVEENAYHGLHDATPLLVTAEVRFNDVQDIVPSRWDALFELIATQNGSFTLTHHKGEYIVSLFWGQEAPDSDMYGAAAHGMNEVGSLAIAQCLKEAGI